MFFNSDKKVTNYQGSSGPGSVTGTPPLPASRKITPRVGPNGRMMVKSFSQDAASNMGSVAASVAATTSLSEVATTSAAASMTTSLSETLLQTKNSNLSSKPPLPKSTSASSVASSQAALSGEQLLAPSASSHSLRPPTVEEESHSAASDSGSVASELDSTGKKSKKKRSFFNFRRKKEKIP